jgi:hypothetical protein
MFFIFVGVSRRILKESRSIAIVSVWVAIACFAHRLGALNPDIQVLYRHDHSIA